MASIAEVEASDVPEVLALVREVLSEHDLVFGDGSATDLQLTALPGVYRDAGGRFWVARADDGRLVGTVGVYPVAPARLELRKMYLRPDARGTGLAARLLAEAVAFARSVGARELVLDTASTMQRAMAFYERYGFVRDDRFITGERCARGYLLRLG